MFAALLMEPGKKIFDEKFVFRGRSIGQIEMSPFLGLANPLFINTVFPRILSAETILFWKLECGNYSKEETIQGRKLLIIRRF